jgi:phosphohistidine phosphatase
MRTLVLIRHAKSSWANPLQSDFDRPLNERGKEEAPEMGIQLKKRKLFPDLIISSTAVRTRQTSRHIAEQIGYEPDNIKWEEKLYHCIPSVFEEVINEIDESVKTVFIVAHNPGITEFVNQLSPDFKIDNMPTCGVVATYIKDAEWNNFFAAEHQVFLFEYPGMSKPSHKL